MEHTPSRSAEEVMSTTERDDVIAMGVTMPVEEPRTRTYQICQRCGAVHLDHRFAPRTPRGSPLTEVDPCAICRSAEAREEEVTRALAS
jgi:hypothetical protein